MNLFEVSKVAKNPNKYYGIVKTPDGVEYTKGFDSWNLAYKEALGICHEKGCTTKKASAKSGADINKEMVGIKDNK